MFLEDVKNRRSVRTFDGEGLSAEVLDDLKEYAKKNCKSLQYSRRICFLKCKGARSF